jgi:putative MATE family efflux protein
MVNGTRNRRSIDMTQGPELKRIVLFALPIMFGQLLQQLYSTVDGIVVGNYVSSAALAAVGNCMTMSFLFIALSNGMANGSGIVISQAFGAGRERDMRDAAASVLLVMVVLGAALTLFGTLGAEFCVKRLLAVRDPGLQAQAAAYLRVYSLGLIFTFLYNAAAAILRAVGDSRAVLYFLLVSTVVNVVLDLLFVAVFRWGVVGAAWATVISQLACVIVSFLYMLRNYPVFRFHSLRELRPPRRMLALCLRMGAPSTLQQLIISSGHVFSQRLVNSFGEAAIAAVTVGTRFDHYCSIPSLSFFQAMASFTGQNVGAGRYDRVTRGVWRTAGLNCAVVAVLCLGMYLFAAPLSGLFGVEGETLRLSVDYLHVLAMSMPIFALYLPFNGTFQGAGAPLTCALISLSALATRVIASYVLVYAFHFGPEACWVTYWFGWVIALVYAMIVFLRGKWKTKRVVGGAAPAETEAAG